MAVSIRQLHPVFAGEVSDVDLTKPIAPADVAAIDAGMDRYAVLVFREQKISDAEQMAFTLNFGPLEKSAGGHIAKAHERRLEPGMIDVSNLDQTGQTLARDDRRRLFNLGNRLWHSDSSYRAIPAKYSLLSGRVIATEGGNTEFADMRAAYDALDARTKAEIEELICEHSLIYSRGSLGFDELTAEERAMFRPVRQRLVRTHPITGRKSLYLASHVGRIFGMSEAEGSALIDQLTAHATQRQFVYVHRWRVHDLVIWDNRCTMHRGSDYDDLRWKRDMQRATVCDTANSCEQAGIQIEAAE
jgi:alpha-ketoglutarate-dependent 2,4-dichlorophenoxyacetate dioxygenase